MLLHFADCVIYFGDLKDGLVREECEGWHREVDLLSVPVYSWLKDMMHIEQLVFPYQVNDASGLIITSHEQVQSIRPFTVEADYLVTKERFVGLGIATADCLPVVLYDSFNQVISVVHAGWCGSVNTIVVKTLDSMRENFGTKPENLRTFLGPSAKVCCYEITEDIKSKFEEFDFVDQVVQKRRSKLFLDLPKFNQLLLEEVGVRQAAFHVQCNKCTICDHSFCSYRRDGKTTHGQMTVACLQ